MTEGKETGRPAFEFNQGYADILCDLISANSMSVGAICRNMKEQDPNFPGKTTIFKWLANNEDFANQYTRAKKAQAELLVDEIIEIADERAFDTKINDLGYQMPDHEYMQRSRLRIDTRKWLACKLIPKVYGERIIADINDGNKKSINEMSKEELMLEYQTSKKAVEALDDTINTN
jgi:hypothetical protein